MPTATTEPTPRRTMPWSQFQFLVHAAGLKGTDAARRENAGASASAVEALADYAAGGLPAPGGGTAWQAPSAGGYTALQKAAALYETAGAELPEMGVLRCFAEPKAVYLMARQAERELSLHGTDAAAALANFVDTFEAEAFDFSCGIPLGELKAALAWLQSELAALRGDDAAGKEGAENPPTPRTDPGLSTNRQATPTGS